MRVYISGAISGTSDYLERFEAAEQMIKEDYPHMDVVNPARIAQALPKWLDYANYMELDLKLLKECDYIFMIPNWEQSRGATIEYNFAQALGIKELKLK